MKNKAICLLFLSVLSIYNINSVYGVTPFKIKCLKTITKLHEHRIFTCDNGISGISDDYVGDYYGRYWGSQCASYNKTGYTSEVGTSDAAVEICEEYALFIGGKQIDTIEKFLEQVPATELIKFYDPNMVP